MIIILCQDNAIRGLDFTPLGTLTATIGPYGMCLISDIYTDDYDLYSQICARFGKVQNTSC